VCVDNQSSSATRLPIAVLISGGGTTLRNLIERMKAGSLPVEIRLVISSSARAKGLEFAAEAGIPTLVVERKSFATADAFSEAIFEPCRAAGVQLVVMGGFLKHVLIPEDFTRRVINIHPALLPKFGGKGMYGLFVHAAVIAAGENVTGCTVHYVDNEYDHGEAILRREVPVQANDTPDSLQQRVFVAEREALPAAISSFAKTISTSR
jgi:phosphoribosylglycinamide formyltransferase-1